MKKIRLGLIGTNFAAKVHAPAFRLNPDCELVAIASKNQKNAQHVANTLSIPKVYSSWKELLQASDIDAISIAATPSVQPQIVLKALEMRKAVLVEKPMALTLSKAKLMSTKAQKYGVANMINFSFSHIDPWCKAKQYITSNTLGNLSHVIVNWNVETRSNLHKDLNNWKTQPSMGGGTLYNFVSHVLHYIEWFGGPITNLHCKNFADTFVTICAKFLSGAAVNISVSTNSFMGLGHKIEFYAEHGSMILENKTTDYMRGFNLQIATRKQPRWESYNYTDNSDPSQDGRIIPVSKLIKQFVCWIQNPNNPDNRYYPKFSDGLRVQYLLEQATLSNLDNNWIKV